MFISKLTHTIEAYDKYGIHRLNGVKVVFVLLVLFVVNLIVYIPNPYFYFFYVPITAMNAEVIGLHIKEKYTLFIYATLGSCAMIFLFNLLKPYPLFFLLFSFSGTMTLYLIVLHKNRSMLILVPIVLSLSAYSLLYADANTDFYAVFNNAVTTLVALICVLAALILFPLSYYYRLWLRALRLLVQECLDNLILLHENQALKLDTVQGHTVHLVHFSQMLPRQLPTYTILKINLLINRLHLMSCVAGVQEGLIEPAELQPLILAIRVLLGSIEREEPCTFIATGNATLSSLIHSWNYLCSRQ